MKLELTIPPTCNNLFANAKKGFGRYPTPQYKAWQEANGWPVKLAYSHHLGEYVCPVRIIVTIRGGKGFPITSDIDNRLKAVLDLLKTCGVIAGDSVQHVREVRAVYIPPEQKSDKATCQVEIFPVGEPISIPKARTT